MGRSAPSETDLSAAGDVFRRERQRRRLSIPQVVVDTKIRAALVAAIEGGYARDLPTPVFAKGLIRTYARYLAVNPEPYLAAYAALIPDAAAAPRREGHRDLRPRRARVPSILFPALGLLLLGGYLYQEYAAFVSGTALVEPRPPGGAIFISTPLPSPPAELRQVPATTATPFIRPVSTVSAPAAPPPTVAATPTALAAPTATPWRGVQIDALVSARVWVQVESDGKVVFSGILNSGDRRTWTATQKLMVWSGNAGSISVTFNGKSLGPLGAPGEVVKVTWTAT